MPDNANKLRQHTGIMDRLPFFTQGNTRQAKKNMKKRF